MFTPFFRSMLPLLMCCLLPATALAATGTTEKLNLTGETVGFAAIVIFVIAYLVVMSEEFTHLRKSKPVILAAGVIWGMIAFVYAGNGDNHGAASRRR